MGRKSTSDADAALFRNAVGTVKTLDNDRHTPERTRRGMRLRRAEPVAELSGENFPDTPHDDSPGFADRLYFARTGVQKKTLKRLAREQLHIDAQVDLHGMTVDRARNTLATFLVEAQHFRYRCVLIIHGKGHRSANRVPVIKGLLDRWLRLDENVLAFCSAQPRSGGTGAVYVLLKTAR